MEPKLLTTALPVVKKKEGDGAFAPNGSSSGSSTGILAVEELMGSGNLFRKEHEKIWSLFLWI